MQPAQVRFAGGALGGLVLHRSLRLPLCDASVDQQRRSLGIKGDLSEDIFSYFSRTMIMIREKLCKRREDSDQFVRAGEGEESFSNPGTFLTPSR